MKQAENGPRLRERERSQVSPRKKGIDKMEDSSVQHGHTKRCWKINFNMIRELNDSKQLEIFFSKIGRGGVMGV